MLILPLARSYLAMNTHQPQPFNAAVALAENTVAARRTASAVQNLLDISEKTRTSVLPWRGQFSPQLVEHFLGDNTVQGQKVLDPFCGSGTVMFEAARKKLNAIGFDVNPAAIRLAELCHFCSISAEARSAILDVLTNDVQSLEASSCEETILLSDIEEMLRDASSADGHLTIARSALLLLAFGNTPSTNLKRLKRALSSVRAAFEDLPYHIGEMVVRSQDARKSQLEAGSVDYLITSPPYINVFNYHQNYRPIVEAMGDMPLVAARSELGANRKFRQNRYMTAVQYCMDMAQFFEEAHRVLKSGAKMTIVLGRESNIRGVPLKNGELIASIASDGLSFEISEWNERKFMNRFGEVIYEDILTLKRPERCGGEAIEVGRAVGKQGLQNALKYCPEERRPEIEAAVAAAAKIEVSPFY